MGAISSRTIVLDHIKLRREANLLPSLDAKLVTADIAPEFPGSTSKAGSLQGSSMPMPMV